MQIVNHKRIVFKEKRSKLTINNPNQVQVTMVEVDDCEITEGLRCDHLFLANDLEHFVELKGQDINHAVKQITSTIHKLSEVPKGAKKLAFIISIRSPLSTASIQNLRVKFKKIYGTDLIVQKSPWNHTL